MAADFLSDPECTEVVGLATEKHDSDEGHSLTVMYLNLPTWAAEDAAKASAMQKGLGFFARPTESRIGLDEYPGCGQ